ncbi:MAG: hypothetical protein COX20_02835 [Desulfobacterales bacterium CG23_combo_of_CG06-09_8_20_14_all_52_9]|nr:MAG: hypothetical protein COX20_02835 [Desulfobacterales bacterium CG23_combo_of_CG06-09_8_20_14_all_52_9]
MLPPQQTESVLRSKRQIAPETNSSHGISTRSRLAQLLFFVSPAIGKTRKPPGPKRNNLLKYTDILSLSRSKTMKRRLL